MNQDPLPSHEHLFADQVRRLAKFKSGRRAVHILLSELQPHHRRSHHVRIAANAFDVLARKFQGELFFLANRDLVFLCKGASVDDIDQVIVRIRYLFADDPIVASDDPERFCRWFDLEKDYNALAALAKGAQREAQSSRVSVLRQSKGAVASCEEPELDPISPAQLEKVEKNLEVMDVTGLVRRQIVSRIDAGAQPQPLFNELYVSIAELRRALLPESDLLGDQWLFLHLTGFLDKRLLKLLPSQESKVPLPTSLNLNISTVLSPEFLKFDEALRRHTDKTMIIEVQPVDIFADVGTFMFARDFARERGYRICVDGLNYLTFPLIDRKSLDLDLEKLRWSPEMRDANRQDARERFETAIEAVGPNRIILCRCDDESAVEFGQSIGIRQFQGRHVDRLARECAA